MIKKMKNIKNILFRKLKRFKTRLRSKKQWQSNMYSYFQIFFLSFYSQNAYVDAVKRWRGMGVFYILFIAFMVTLPIYIQTARYVNQYFEKYISPSISTMPDLLVRDGQIRIVESGTDKPAKSQVWIWPPAPTAEHKTPYFLINTKRTIGSFGNAFIPILVTRDTVRVQVMSPVLKNYPLGQSFKMPLDEDRLMTSEEFAKLMLKLKNDFLYSSYSSLAFLMWGCGIFLVGLAAFIVKIASSLFLNYDLRWTEATRLFVVAMTPGLVLLDFVICFMPITKFWGIGFLFLTLLYCLYGARACRAYKAPVWNPSLGSL